MNKHSKLVVYIGNSTKRAMFGHDTYRPLPFYHTWLNHGFHMYLLFCGAVVVVAAVVVVQFNSYHTGGNA